MTNAAVLLAVLGVQYASAGGMQTAADQARSAALARASAERILAGFAGQTGASLPAFALPVDPPQPAAVEHVAENERYRVRIQPQDGGYHAFLGQFNSVLHRHRGDGHENDSQWQSLMKDARRYIKRAESQKEVLYAIDGLINRWIDYRTDEKRYSTRDYWATPKETLDGQRGDCEDYALLKYFVLKEVLPEARLFIVISSVETSMTSRGGHATLMVVIDSGAYILNNNGTATVDDFSEMDESIIFRNGFNEESLLVFVEKTARK
jgi:predicted transglutaminase-like cysteine proteinase